MVSGRKRDVAASVRQRLLNYAATKKVDPNLVLLWYGLERLLYRLSISTHHDRFILKGAMLFRVWGENAFRATKDLDLLGVLRDDAEAVRKVFVAICAQGVEDDGLEFDAASVRAAEIRTTQEYGGYRITLSAKLGSAVIPLQVDVGFGDAITPAPEVSGFPSMLDQPGAQIRVYPRETVVAEKFHAIVVLAMSNSRIKDYYDLWYLSRRFEFSGQLLAAAIAATFKRRATGLPSETPQSAFLDRATPLALI